MPGPTYHFSPMFGAQVTALTYILTHAPESYGRTLARAFTVTMCTAKDLPNAEQYGVTPEKPMEQAAAGLLVDVHTEHMATGCFMVQDSEYLLGFILVRLSDRAEQAVALCLNR